MGVLAARMDPGASWHSTVNIRGETLLNTRKVERVDGHKLKLYARQRTKS